MTHTELSAPTYRRDLGEGLVLRWSTPQDSEALATLYGYVFRAKADAPPSQRNIAWTRDMMSGRYPLLTPGDFALVEDTGAAKIVAAACLMAQTWEYEGIAFGVGRPETVATLPEYRNRGLIRHVFALMHARSAEHGQLAQGITGIEYYYRQFGYEYAVDLGGMRSLPLDAVPPLKEGETEPYHLRDATADDVPRILALYDRERGRGPVSARLDADYLRFTMGGHSAESGEGWRTLLVVDPAGAVQGYVFRKHMRWGGTLAITALAVQSGVSLAAVLPALLRALKAQALDAPPSRPDDTRSAARLGFDLGQAHPLYDLLGDTLLLHEAQPYAWYVRVPDLPGFMRQIAPALERRLAASALSGHSGELRLNFYRGGLRLVFECGRLTLAEEWRREIWVSEPNAGFPPLVFLQLLFGRRSLTELRHAFPDVSAESDARPLLEALFPAQPSWVLPLD